MTLALISENYREDELSRPCSKRYFSSNRFFLSLFTALPLWPPILHLKAPISCGLLFFSCCIRAIFLWLCGFFPFQRVNRPPFLLVFCSTYHTPLKRKSADFNRASHWYLWRTSHSINVWPEATVKDRSVNPKGHLSGPRLAHGQPRGAQSQIFLPTHSG